MNSVEWEMSSTRNHKAFRACKDWSDCEVVASSVLWIDRIPRRQNSNDLSTVLAPLAIGKLEKERKNGREGRTRFDEVH